eukprot:CAMPEP_0194283920 /NCGR_PEP_ID=MMETSP0169-20130528/26432_1 /TAXON_ID=218684 /ORGANISM="Corethron pennatum, Strain L29A3" /LENGTH=114 /DNA_ID=CAMNT_0039029625 /DNA_START=297 /DNA_END=638 /DNA_ORIENTATION=+
MGARSAAGRLSCRALAGGRFCVCQICGGGCDDDDDDVWGRSASASASGGTSSSASSGGPSGVAAASPSPWYWTFQSSSSISMQAPFLDTHMTNLAIWLGDRTSMTRPNSTSSSS